MRQLFGSRVVWLIAFAAGFLSSTGVHAQELRTTVFMSEARKGFEQIYNIDYSDAWATFSALRTRYPQHPAPPLYLATVIWLRELFDRNELDLDRFIAPGYFTKPTQRKMKAEDRKAFFDQLRDCRNICEATLRQDPKNADARYFLGAAYGVEGAFAITLDRSYSEAFSKGKKAYQYHHSLVQDRPEYYDAYMSVGLYEYVVDNLPWYIKWVAAIVGYRGSKERGFEYLERTAQKGVYSADDARVLQMVLFVRERQLADALRNVTLLRQRYPKNFILHVNHAQILEQMGRTDTAVAEYKQVLAKAEARTPNYGKIPLAGFRSRVASRFMQMRRFAAAHDEYSRLLTQNGISENDRADAHLGAGQALDAQGKRSEAVRHYETVLKLPDHESSHSRARRFLSRPYSGAD